MLPASQNLPVPASGAVVGQHPPETLGRAVDGRSVPRADPQTAPSHEAAASPEPSFDRAVHERYRRAAAEVEPELCCPSAEYDAESLTHVPEAIRRVDYGCGDPSRHVGAGETVLDLGSGSGKICYILSRRVGAEGRVIGVDFNDAMLELARAHQAEVAATLGYANVSFRKGRIQDLALDLDRVDHWLADHPVDSVERLAELEALCERWRRESPMIPDDSVDVIVSNCVLNLVGTEAKARLFAEMHRVLRRGGRAVISDIVCDEDPTPAILDDAELWSGCIAGAFREDRFLARFEDAGFHGVEILARPERPWRVIDGIEFRSMTVRAFKGKAGPCLERNQAVVYRGPWKQVRDDDGHVLPRGRRLAVCDKTFRLLTDPTGPYAGSVIGIEPREAVPIESARPFACRTAALRDPRQTKGGLDGTEDRETTDADDPLCGPGCDC